MGARETDSMFTHRIFFFLIKSVYLPLLAAFKPRHLQTLLSLICSSPPMWQQQAHPHQWERKQAERHVVPLPGSQSWEVQALGLNPRRLTTLLHAPGTTHAIPQPTLGMRWAVPTLQVGNPRAGVSGQPRAAEQ